MKTACAQRHEPNHNNDDEGADTTKEAPLVTAEEAKFSFSKEGVAVEATLDEKISAVLSSLKTINIDSEQCEVVKHEPTPDMESILKVLSEKSKEGIVCKNLFVKAKKSRKDVENDSRIWLISVPHDAIIDYKELTETLGYPKKGILRQAKQEELLEYLRLLPGHISPFGLLNDPNITVNVVLDADMVHNPDEKLWFHPLSNQATLCIKAKELMSFITNTGRKPVLVKFRKETN